MPRNKRNCLRVFILNEKGKEIEKRLYPKQFTKMKRTDWSDGIMLTHIAYDAVMEYLGNPEKLPDNVKYAWSHLSIPEMNPDIPREQKEEIRQSTQYKKYKEQWVRSQIVSCTDSMHKDSYLWLHHACNHNGDEDMDDGITNMEYKDYLWLNHLFFEMLGGQKSRVDTGAWVFRDGSYITVDVAQHRRLVEEYMGKKEKEQELWWVKVSLYKVFTHASMTKAQWKTIADFTKKYELSERFIEHEA